MTSLKSPSGRHIRLFVVILALASMMCAGNKAGGAASFSDGKILGKAIGVISRNYFDPARINPKTMLNGALDQMQLKIPEILITDRDSGQLAVTVGLASKRIKSQPMNSLEDLDRTLQEVLSFVMEHYTGNADTPSEEIEYAAIEGMLDALDPHSNFLPPKVFKEFMVGTSGKFGGLGIVISIKDGFLTVVAPIEGTPAAKAGVRSGDRIIQIDDESTINMSLTDAVNKLRGDKGTKVSIVTERSGSPSRKITLVRAEINIDSVQHSLLTNGNKRIGYIKIKSFQENTEDDVKIALADLHKDGELSGLILDLRNNPGGLLNTAADVADDFLSKGIVVSTVGPRDQVIEQSNARSQGTEPDYPLIVLINEGSASASEIVAGALVANDRAIAVGRRSFGKGSVQTIFDLGNKSALKLTIAQYKPAGTKIIQLVGMAPDIDLKPTIVDVDSMNIVGDELMRELELEKFLKNDTTETVSEKPEDKSMYQISFLKPKEDEKKREEMSLKEYSKSPDLAGDFAVELSKNLLANAGSSSRKTMLSSIAKSVGSAEAAQKTAIENALKAMNINWSSAPASGAPKLSLSYHLYKGKEEITRVRAGDKVRIELTATNTGNGPYSQLIAIGKSDSPFLSEREFPLGKIEPGETRRFSSPIEIPEALPSQQLSMDLNFQEEHNKIPEPFKVAVPVDELLKPSFAFTAKFSDVTKGKPIPAGSSMPMAVSVINNGPGSSSQDTTTTISNECGESIFIEQGRSKLGAILPKTRRNVLFKFHMLPDKPPADCAIKLTIADFKRAVILTKKIGIKSEEGIVKINQGAEYKPPRIELANVPSSTKEEAISISGTISDNDPVRDCFIFVGDKKVAYIPNADATDEMEFKANLPLEPGQNYVTIGARDREDITARKLIVVERTSGVKSKDKKKSLLLPALTP